MASKLVSNPINDGEWLSGLPQREEPTALLRALDSEEINEAERLEAVKGKNIHKEELRSEGGQLASVAQDLPKTRGDLRKSLAKEVATPATCVGGIRKWWSKKMNKKKKAKLRLARLEEDSAELDRAREQLRAAVAKHTDLEEAHRDLLKQVSFDRKNVVTVTEEFVQKSKSWSAHLQASNDSLLEMVIPNSGHPEMVRVKSTPTVVNPSFVMDCEMTLLLKLIRAAKKCDEHLRAIVEREWLLDDQRAAKEIEERRVFLTTALQPHAAYEAEMLEKTGEELNNGAQNSRKEMDQPNEEIVQKSWSAHLASSDSLLEMVIPNSGHPEMVRIKSAPTVVNPSFVMDCEMTLLLKRQRLLKASDEQVVHGQTIMELQELLADEQATKGNGQRRVFITFTPEPHTAYIAELLEKTGEQLNNEAQNSRKEMDQPNEG